MTWTSASGDDAGVGSKVPSTPADSSKGMGSTLPLKSAPASSSNVSDAENARGGALISKPPQVRHKKTCREKSICISLLVVVSRFVFVASTIRLFCICSDVLLEVRGTTEAASAPEPIAQRPRALLIRMLVRWKI